MKHIEIQKYQNKEMTTQFDDIIEEKQVNIYINSSRHISLICLAQDLTELVVGYLFSERIIDSFSDITMLEHTDEYSFNFVIEGYSENMTNANRVKTSGFAYSILPETFFSTSNTRNLNKNNSEAIFTAEDINQKVHLFSSRSMLFKATGAVHSCNLFLSDGTDLFYEDIGRHNALDKVIGKLLMDDKNCADSILITSGRLSSEMVIKAAAIGIPIVISSAAPTDRAVAVAEEHGMTLVGFARDKRFNIYTGSFRIGAD
ncbi:MAG: formate dehydrogenase accessory sulfurtransferase FdhD [Oscillospiraceae bacterium]|nr:formate dehydrogenase accessory sulfurtransferase FdhD [Oscillospiraceae bacterium]